MKTVFHSKLFKKHSTGAIGTWEIEVITNADTTATYVVRSAKNIGGKQVETTTHVTEGKNLGKANETSPLEQATFEAQAKIKKKLDTGYVDDINKAHAPVTNSLGFKKPMLAQPIEKVKDWTFPVYVQPKLDGHRCLATVQDGKVVMYSRQGKLLDVEHIREELQYQYNNKWWDGTTLDGELYCHGETLQTLSSWIKKPQEASKQLQYYVYDVLCEGNFSYRLDCIYKCHFVSDIVNYTETCLLTSEKQLSAYHNIQLANGYEGTIVRDPMGYYEEGKRSKSLIKLKDFQDDEFLIIDVAKGKRNERLNTEVAIFHCQTKDFKEFTVTAPGTAQEKHDFYINGQSYVGKYLTVKFFNYTPDGIPFHPVALRIREDV